MTRLEATQQDTDQNGKKGQELSVFFLVKKLKLRDGGRIASGHTAKTSKEIKISISNPKRLPLPHLLDRLFTAGGDLEDVAHRRLENG